MNVGFPGPIRSVVRAASHRANQAEHRARGIRDELAAAQAEIARLREELGIRRASRLGFYS